MPRFILITGCSGGGKSTLLDALAEGGQAVMQEPGRRIVQDALVRDDPSVLPWVDPAAFARRAVAIARADLAGAASHTGNVFFDRGLIDAAAGLEHYAGVRLRETLGDTRPYSDPVFLAPPWPDIFQTDRERRHGIEEAIAEYARLQRTLADLAYEVRILPKTTVAERVGFVLRTLQQHPAR